MHLCSRVAYSLFVVIPFVSGVLCWVLVLGWVLVSFLV